MAQNTIPTDDHTPLQFFAQLHEAGCAALRRAHATACDGQLARADHFLRMANEIVGCLRECVENERCDLAQIYDYSVCEIEAGLHSHKPEPMLRALRVLEGVQDVWQDASVARAMAA